MELNSTSHISITSAIQEALEKCVSAESKNIITDIHLQPNMVTGELAIYNDDEDECEECSEICVECFTPKLIMLVIGWILLFFMFWRVIKPEQWNSTSSSILIALSKYL